VIFEKLPLRGDDFRGGVAVSAAVVEASLVSVPHPVGTSSELGAGRLATGSGIENRRHLAVEPAPHGGHPLDWLRRGCRFQVSDFNRAFAFRHTS
jgi:hypothetical protein